MGSLSSQQRKLCSILMLVDQIIGVSVLSETSVCVLLILRPRDANCSGRRLAQVSSIGSIGIAENLKYIGWTEICVCFCSFQAKQSSKCQCRLTQARDPVCQNFVCKLLSLSEGMHCGTVTQAHLVPKACNACLSTSDTVNGLEIRQIRHCPAVVGSWSSLTLLLVLCHT